MKKRLEKGTYGYMDRLKMREWKKSALMLAIPVLVFLIGWAVMKTRLQVVTVIAVVGCLPGCNEVVHAIMASRYHSIERKLYEEVEAERGSRGKGVRAEETGRKAGGAEGEDEAA